MIMCQQNEALFRDINRRHFADTALTLSSWSPRLEVYHFAVVFDDLSLSPPTDSSEEVQ